LQGLESNILLCSSSFVNFFLAGKDRTMALFNGYKNGVKMKNVLTIRLILIQIDGAIHK